MGGENRLDEYKLIFSIGFRKSLREIVDYWKYSLSLSDERINKFVSLIYSSLELVKHSPYSSKNVTEQYGFDEKTYRILIGKSYAIFYRINEEKKTILVGKIFGQKQMRVEF